MKVDILPIVFDGKLVTNIKPEYRHAHTLEEYREMLENTADIRPIKIFFPREPFVIGNNTNLWEYIGDLSQDMLECSYNEDEIRVFWNTKTLDTHVYRCLVEYPWRLEHWKREDGRYSDLLTALVMLHGGWAEDWGPIITPLTQQEIERIYAFNEKYEIAINEEPCQTLPPKPKPKLVRDSITVPLTFSFFKRKST